MIDWLQKAANPSVQKRIRAAIRLRRSGRSTDDPELDEAIDALIAAGARAIRVARENIRRESEELERPVWKRIG